MRKRFFRARRASLPQSLKPKWVTSFFDTTLDNTGATATSLVLLDPAQITAVEDREMNRVYSIRRVIFKGMCTPFPLMTVEGNTFMRLAMACYVNDVEDTDSSIITTGPSDILNTSRVLHVGAEAHWVQSAAAATVDQQMLYRGCDASFDIRTRVNMRNDDLMVYQFQLATSMASAGGSPRIIGYSRVLVVPP